ncbi:MAG TPA: type IX secretion system membrane protein PorP/SprF [Flavobacteriaceae bacterium]|nr:type IX secretion system membrane protein PorP/SprF [Flavobacteriaceae bacterium]
MTHKNLKLHRFLLPVLLFFGFVAHSQQESQYTQYMYNTQSFNSAYTGTRGSLSMIGLYRNQWVGIDGAPETLNFAIQSPVGIQGVSLGMGFTSDKIGPSSESNVSADFAYVIRVSENAELSFGIKGGISLLDLDPNKLLIYDPNDYNLAQKNYVTPIVGTGFYLFSDKWYVGLSTPNFLETNHYNDVRVSTATEKTHLYLIGGYVFDLSDDVKLKPTILGKAVWGAPAAIDLSVNTLLYERVTFGLAYRLGSAVSGLAGFQVNDHIMIGYAYDYETTELSRYNSGSHEIFLRFELGTRLKAKVNPRFF